DEGLSNALEIVFLRAQRAHSQRLEPSPIPTQMELDRNVHGQSTPPAPGGTRPGRRLAASRPRTAQSSPRFRSAAIAEAPAAVSTFVALAAATEHGRIGRP